MTLLHKVFLRQQSHSNETLKQSTEEIIENNNYLDQLKIESIIDGVEYENEFAPNSVVKASDSPRTAVENIAIHAIKADVRNGWKNHPVARAKAVNPALDELLRDEYEDASELLESVYTPDSATIIFDGEEAYVTSNKDIIGKQADAISRGRLSPFMSQLSVNTLYWWLSQEHEQYLD